MNIQRLMDQRDFVSGTLLRLVEYHGWVPKIELEAIIYLLLTAWEYEGHITTPQLDALVHSVGKNEVPDPPWPLLEMTCHTVLGRLPCEAKWDQTIQQYLGAVN